MIYGFTHRIFITLIVVFSLNVAASDKDYQLQIRVHYQQNSDSWNVNYELPIAVEHVAFSRQSNFDRRKLYKIDESKFKWEQEENVQLIKSVDGSTFDSLNIEFTSQYDVIHKDYTPNLKYTDGSVLLYTNHLALDANLIEDAAVSPIGASFKGTKFHFYSPNQNIVFLGKTYRNNAQWTLEGEGTYVYFGNIKPIENANMIALVDPDLPEWAWHKTKKYLPELFAFYEKKTGHPLNFKPIVFFNYNQVDADYLHYSGGTLNGLVQLTITGKHWNAPNEQQYNLLFHFLAHEAAHFWNVQMFAYDEQNHAWMHEGGADTFANIAMMEFGLISYEQMIQKFEDAANSCFLNKGKEPLEQSAKLWRYRSYYNCGAAMGLASHAAVNASNSGKTVFDVWKHIFDANIEDRTYNQQDYLDALSSLIGSTELSLAFDRFSSTADLDNQKEVASWFEGSTISTQYSEDYPISIVRHWGIQVMRNLMSSHCNKRISFTRYDDYLKTYPLDGCSAFEQSMEVQFVDGSDIFKEGISVYRSFEAKCERGEGITLQDRNKKTVAEIKCLAQTQRLKPYLTLEAQQ
ncbi:MAG: hypothetical protein HWE26_01550 [Alteromonadaceae bacterium]|nr:hypothetical protein [Alteromonadaceae bacterium]